MGQSVTAILCYGVKVDPSSDLPWEEYDEDAFETPEVEIVRHCMYDQSMYVAAVPGTVQKAYWGDPEIVSVETPSAESVQALLASCKDRELVLEGEPGWILCSWWSC